MRGRNFLFNPTEDEHKSCKTKYELTDLFTRSIPSMIQGVLKMSQNIVEIKQLAALSLKHFFCKNSVYQLLTFRISNYFY